MSLAPRIDEALRDAQSKLDNSEGAARLEAEILLCEVLHCDRTYLHTWPEHELDTEQQTRFQQLIARRAGGEPVAHITGVREFWDMTLRVTPDTLIPRPETERLVELALERIPPDSAWRIADLGTGSGAIALAVARERPRCRLVASDASAAALAVAQDNAERLGVDNIEFRHGSWFAPLAGERFAMILANPPYVHPEDPHLQRGDLRFEPASALSARPDGLGDLRHIISEARQHLVAPGWLILEHGYDQGAALRQLLTEAGYVQVQTFRDLARQERTTLGQWLSP
jgi:release factor glutamine methyltransferase